MTVMQDMMNRKPSFGATKKTQASAEEKIKNINASILDLPKLLPAAQDEVSIINEMSPISMTESGSATGIFEASVGGNGFAVIPTGDTTIADLVLIEVTYTSLGGNTKTDSITSQQIKIGQAYAFVSKIFGKWTVKLTSASKTVKAVQLTGL